MARVFTVAAVVLAALQLVALFDSLVSGVTLTGSLGTTNFGFAPLIILAGIILSFYNKWRWVGQGLLIAGLLAFLIGYAFCSSPGNMRRTPMPMQKIMSQ